MQDSSHMGEPEQMPRATLESVEAILVAAMDYADTFKQIHKRGFTDAEREPFAWILRYMDQPDITLKMADLKTAGELQYWDNLLAAFITTFDVPLKFVNPERTKEYPSAVLEYRYATLRDSLHVRTRAIMRTLRDLKTINRMPPYIATTIHKIAEFATLPTPIEHPKETKWQRRKRTRSKSNSATNAAASLRPCAQSSKSRPE